MRIIAGEQRGMRLASLPGEETRPTLERVKEGIFSSLHTVLPGASVLDLFAGSGQLGLEALSRGAAHCTFVDSRAEAVRTVRANCQKAGYTGKSRILRSDAFSFLARCHGQFDLILMDPPYRADVFPGMLAAAAACAAPGGQVVCESERGISFPEEVGALRLQKQYLYGTVMVSRYKEGGQPLFVPPEPLRPADYTP